MRSFSLPTQRCFSTKTMPTVIGALFSAYAEVFPPGLDSSGLPRTFLCLRRGVSSPYYFDERMAAFSLPTQRCFPSSRPWFWRQLLFSAYAEVFLTTGTRSDPARTFLCLRRGVSGGNGCVRDGSNFSLPTQRCFHNTDTTI